MTFFLFTIIFVSVCVFIVLKTSKKNEPQQQSQQPIHFDILDDNGNPMQQHLSSNPRQSVGEPKIRRSRYFCIKDKGYHISIWPKDSNNWFPGLDYIEFNIAGMSHRDKIEDYLGEHAGRLVAEPNNPYDYNAIKVLAGDNYHVGYVPKDMTAEVRRHTKLPCKCFFYIGENDGSYFSSCYVKL